MITRDEFIDTLKGQLDELNAQADKAEQMLASASEGAKDQISERLDDLKARRNEAQQTLKQVADAGQDQWEGLKEKAEKTRKAFEQSVHYFMSQMKS